MTYVIAVAWIFVVGLVAVVQAASPQGTLLGALGTVLVWGALPLGLLLYLMGATARVQRRRAVARSAADPDRGGHAPGDAVAPEREET